MNEELIRLEERIRARIDLCTELNNFLAESARPSVWSIFGVLRWWRLNFLLQQWFKKTNEMLDEHGRVIVRCRAEMQATAKAK